MMILDFNWFAQEGVQNVINMINTILNIIRIIVPIGLILMTTIDIAKKVINPSEKEGQKKIMIRAIAALIVFLIPTVINLFFDLTHIKREDIEPNPTIKPTEEPNKHINEVSISNCPTNKTFGYDDTITLNSNIKDDYTGDLRWSVVDGNKYVRIKEINRSRSVNVDVLQFSADTNVTIQLDADGKSSKCTIQLATPKLSSLSFTNCPDIKKHYLLNEKINLKTDIPMSYTGEIKWSTDYPDAIKIKNTSSKRTADIEITDQPELGFAVVIVSAGGITESCIINIDALKELKITNCPNSSQIYHVGDKIELTSNIPSFYKREPIWQSSTSGDYINITPSNNGQSAIVEITGIPDDKYIVVGLGADSKGTSCGFNVEN